jgi:hypothetical protein
LIKTDGSKFIFQPTERDGADSCANWSNECPSNDRFNNFRVEISVPPDWLHHALVQVNDALKPSLATMDFKEGVEAIKKAIYFASRSQTLKERD